MSREAFYLPLAFGRYRIISSVRQAEVMVSIERLAIYSSCAQGHYLEEIFP